MTSGASLAGSAARLPPPGAQCSNGAGPNADIRQTDAKTALLTAAGLDVSWRKKATKLPFCRLHILLQCHRKAAGPALGDRSPPT